MKPNGRLGRALIALGLLAVALFLLSDVLFLGGAFFERDLLWVYLPAAEAFVHAIAEGALPLRDPSTGFGQPLLANPNMQVLYPPTWLHLILAPDRAFSVLIFLHLLFGSAGAAALGLRWSGSRWSSFLAGAFWMMSGPVLSLVNIRHHFDGTAWMPWVLLAFDRLLEQPTRGRMLALGAVFGVQGLAGSADLCIMSALLVVLRLLCEGADLVKSTARRTLLMSLGSLVVSLALAAGVWMPGAEILQSSARSGLTREERTQWSIHPTLAAEFLLPTQVRALPWTPESRGVLTDGRPPFLESIFLGPLVLPLVAAGLLNDLVSKHRRVFLALGILLCGLGSLGRFAPVYDILVAIAPPLGLCRYPAKGAIPLSLLVALLASLGAQALAMGRARRAAAAACVVASLVNGLVSFDLPGLLRGLLDSSNASLLADSMLRVQSGLQFTALLLAVMAAAIGASRTGLVHCLLGLSLGLTLWLNRSMNPTVSTDVIRFRPPHASLFREGGQGRLLAFDYLHYPSRSAQIFNRSTLIVPDKVGELDPASAFIVVVRSALMAPTGGAWGIEYAWDYDLYGLHDLTLRGLSRYLRQVEGQPSFLRMLQLANVTRVAALHKDTFSTLTLERAIALPLPEPLYIYRVPEPLPRAYAVSGVRAVTPSEAQGVILDPGFDPRVEAAIEGGTDLSASKSFQGAVAITSRRSDRTALDVALNEPGHVVLLEGFLPGWHATVDGTSVPVLRTNALFVAAAVPAGRHEVVFTYRPIMAVAGMAVTALTALALFLSLARPRELAKA